MGPFSLFPRRGGGRGGGVGVRSITAGRGTCKIKSKWGETFLLSNVDSRRGFHSLRCSGAKHISNRDFWHHFENGFGTVLMCGLLAVGYREGKARTRIRLTAVRLHMRDERVDEPGGQRRRHAMPLGVLP